MIQSLNLKSLSIQLYYIAVYLPTYLPIYIYILLNTYFFLFSHSNLSANPVNSTCKIYPIFSPSSPANLNWQLPGWFPCFHPCPITVSTQQSVIFLTQENFPVLQSSPLTVSEKIPNSCRSQSYLTCSDTLPTLSLLSPVCLPFSLSQPWWLMLLTLPPNAPTLGIYLSASSAWDTLLPGICDSSLYAVAGSRDTSSERPSLTPLYKIASFTMPHCPCIQLCSFSWHLPEPKVLCILMSPITRNQLHPPQTFVCLYSVSSIKQCLTHSIHSTFVEMNECMNE